MTAPVTWEAAWAYAAGRNDQGAEPRVPAVRFADSVDGNPVKLADLEDLYDAEVRRVVADARWRLAQADIPRRDAEFDARYGRAS